MAISKITTGSISDSVAIDTDTLVVDGANNRVGVGTSSPAATTHSHSSTAGSGHIRSSSANLNNFIDIGTDSGGHGVINIGTAGGNMNFETAGTERMRIDSSGRVTMPYQPAFTASGGSNPTHGAGVLRYSSTSQDGFNLNVGSHYNTSNYRFTAPVSGNYFFCFNAYTNSSNGFDAAFRVNGSTKGPQIQDLSTRTGSNTYVSLSVSTIIPLNANDYVDVATTYQAYVDSNCFFSGYLIS